MCSRGMYGRGHAWQGACVVGGMCGRGACMAGRVHDREGVHATHTPCELNHRCL